MNDYDQILRENPILNTERLILRPFSTADVDDVFELARDHEVTRFLTWETHTERKQSVASVEDYFMKNPGIYALELKSEGKCIGCLDLRMEPAHEKASFGYMLNRSYWNQGYMSEALGAALGLAFGKLRLNRVESTHYVGNEASGKVMRKCGMKYEGTARQEVKIRGVFYDVVHYGILAEEFCAV